MNLLFCPPDYRSYEWFALMPPFLSQRNVVFNLYYCYGWENTKSLREGIVHKALSMAKNGILILVVTCFFLASSAIAGPFGLKMGMSLDDIGGEPKKIGPGKYVITRVPEPDSKFENYAVKIAPKGGLYWIKAVGKTMDTTSDGSVIRKKFEITKNELEAAYGNYKSYDFLIDGSTWHQRDDWMRGIIEWERVLGALWKSDTGQSMPDDLLEVFVGVEAVSPEEGFISVEYTFSNMHSCEAELAGLEK